VSRVDELRSEIARGHSGLREAIELAASNWERSRAPRPDEDEVWSPRQAAEHVIAGEIGAAGIIAQALGGLLRRPDPPSFPDAECACAALNHAAAVTDSVLSTVIDEDLDRATEVWGNVEGVMKFVVWHLRDHARQIAGVEQG